MSHAAPTLQLLQLLQLRRDARGSLPAAPLVTACRPAALPPYAPTPPLHAAGMAARVAPRPAVPLGAPGGVG